MVDKDPRGTFKVKSVVLDKVLGIKSNISPGDMPEFAFVGRSNVGKSSLINAIMQRKSLARVSAQPGKTQTINFYRINDQFYLVDLPGYGFTKASFVARAKWGKLVERYLSETRSLKKIFLLVDLRRGFSEDDKLMYDWIVASRIPAVIVATKCDKLGKNSRIKSMSLLKQELMDGDALAIMFSAVDNTGLDLVYEALRI